MADRKLMTNERLHVSLKTDLVVEPQLRNQTTAGKEKRSEILIPVQYQLMPLAGVYRY